MVKRARGPLLIVSILILLSFSLAGALPSAAAVSPYYVHLSWQHDPVSSVTVTWNTDHVSGYSSMVLYGTAPGDYDHTAAGPSHSYSGATVDVHEVELTGLLAGTTYYYRCGDSSFGLSGELSFGVPAGPHTGFRFCAQGDSREGYPGESTENNDFSVWGDIASTACNENPLFSIFTGDFVNEANNESSWNKWFEKGQGLLQKAPFMSCHGNHEGDGSTYFDRFALPGNERWYSCDVASAHFVCLDTGVGASEPALIAAQTDWLDRDLQSAVSRNCDWLIVFFHRSPYASGAHGNQNDIINGWVPIFDKYKVDLVFSGHNHYYERSCPMRNGRAVGSSGDYYWQPQGTIYVTTAGAGAPLAAPGSADWVALNREEYHYCVADVLPGGIIRVSVKNRSGTTVDGFTVAKALPPYNWHFAEGYTGSGFQEYLCLGNTTNATAHVMVTYIFSGSSIEQRLEIGANARATVDVNQAAGEGREVSARVSSDVPIVAERSMYFSYMGKWRGGHDSMGARAAKRWYFAEGTTREGFDEWVTVLNPNPDAANLTFKYMIEGEAETTHSETVAANSRSTFRVLNHIGPGKDVSLLLESDLEVVAERPMYFDYEGLGSHSWKGGHCGAGANALADKWYFAEGTTRDGFEQWLCLQNPNSEDIEVNARFIMEAGQGGPVETVYRVPARQRLTISVNEAVGGDKDVSTVLASSSGFIAERPLYFLYHSMRDGGDDVLGARAASTTWFFAEGYTGKGFDEWLCLANPASADARVEATYYRESGTPISKSYTVPAGSRHTVFVNQEIGSESSVAVKFVSDHPIIAERAMYFDFAGIPGGHCAVGYSL